MIDYIITDEQAQMIIDIFGINAEEVQDWEISEYLDKLIDESYMRFKNQ